MIKFDEIKRLQKNEVELLRNKAINFVNLNLANLEEIVGVLLTGSVSRGDARIGPYGIEIDLTIVLDDYKTIDLSKIVDYPITDHVHFHRFKIDDKIGFQIVIIEYSNLINVDPMYESLMNAYSESEVLYDKSGKISKWMCEIFKIDSELIKKRAIQHFNQFRYLTGEYRVEKWKYRKAWIQLNQILNKAAENYCSFLYCINGKFIPRIDWLSYLTYNLDLRPVNHEEIMGIIYNASNSESGIDERLSGFSMAGTWITNYCKERRWI